MTTYRVRAGFALSLVLLTCSACSSSSAGGSGTPAAASSTSADATAGRTQWGPVSIVLPADFTPVTVPSKGTTQRFGARHGTPSAAGGPEVVAVIVESSPTRKAEAEVKASASIAGATGGRSVATRPVTLAGADDAWALEYEEASPDENRPPVHHRSVVADVGGRLVVIETGGPADEYESSALPGIIASARINS